MASSGGINRLCATGQRTASRGESSVGTAMPYRRNVSCAQRSASCSSAWRGFDRSVFVRPLPPGTRPDLLVNVRSNGQIPLVRCSSPGIVAGVKKMNRFADRFSEQGNRPLLVL
jgi:hypothetical protein